MKQQLNVSHDLWTSLTREQQAEQRAKFEVTVAPSYRPADDLDQLREMALTSFIRLEREQPREMAPVAKSVKYSREFHELAMDYRGTAPFTQSPAAYQRLCDFVDALVSTPTADAPYEPLNDQRIVELYRESFDSMIGRLRNAPTYISDSVLAFARAIEAEVRKKYDVTVEPAYAQDDEVAEVAKEAK